jgi:hypothetical protein
MKESPVGRRFASAAAVGSSTGAADAMVRRNTLPAGHRLSPAKCDAAGDGFRTRNRMEQSINEAAPPSRELRTQRGSDWGSGAGPGVARRSGRGQRGAALGSTVAAARRWVLGSGAGGGGARGLTVLVSKRQRAGQV